MGRKVEVMIDVPGGGVLVTGMGISRRQFVQTAGGVLVAAGVPGCGRKDTTDPPPPPPPPEPTGTLRVVVTGLQAGVVNLTATATRTDQSQAPDIIDIDEASGVGTKVVNTGTYTVQLSVPQGYNQASTNPLTGVVVGENATVDAAFTVTFVVLPGTIQVDVSGLTAAATTGGSAVAQQPGQPSIPITIGTNGSGSAPAAPGTYTVTYTPPSGFQLAGGVTNPATGVVVTSSSTASVPFSVVPNPVGGQPGNIYEFGFDDGTFGSFITGSGGNPTGIGWQFDTVDFFRGTKSVRRNIPVNPANQAYAFFYLLANPQKALYGRFAYKQGPNFDNTSPIKVFRYLAPSFGTQYGTVMFNANTSNLVQVNPDQIQGTPAFGSLSPNVSGNPAIRPNASRGQWHWYEFFGDYNINNNYVFKVWQDDVLIIDGVVQRSISPAPSIGTVQIDGTFNAITTAEDVWYDSIGISTQKMGIPG